MPQTQSARRTTQRRVGRTLPAGAPITTTTGQTASRCTKPLARPQFRLTALLLAIAASHSAAQAQNFTVNTPLDGNSSGTLRAAIFAANAFSGPATIQFAGSPQTLNVGADLPPMNNPFGVTINGNGWTLAGSSTSDTTGNRGLFFGVGTGEAFSSLQSTTSTAYAVNNLKLTNFRARGGDGGGGGAGLGGAIFLNAGNLTLTGVTLGSNRAIGGNGGTQLGQGGGGMGGNGGITTIGHGGGGGGFGATAHGGNMVVAGGFTLPANGAIGNYSGGRDGGTGGRTADIEIDAPGLGGFNGGGGGFGGRSFTSFGTREWYGGGGGGGVNGGTGGSELATVGGGGGFGGGGGGGGVLDGSLPSNILSTGGQGGFGGGGGAAGTITNLYGNPGNGGNGGFGGGGGPSNTINFVNTPQRGLGGFGGGAGTGVNASPPRGGGGLGAGGSIFIRQGASLTINDGTWLGGDVVAGGTGASSGQGLGAAVFLGGSLNYSVSAANTVVLPQDLGGGNNAQITGGLTKSGPGTFVLASSVQTFTGGITVSDGTFQIGNGGTAADLRFAGNIVNNATLAFDHSNSLLIGNRVSGTGALVKNGTGTLTLIALPNSYTGATFVNAGTLAFGSASAIATGSAYTVNGGTVLLTGFDATLGALAGSGGTVSIGTRTLTVGDARSTNAAATITGTTGRLVKQGAGTLTLSGTNAFTGGVTVSDGTLATGSNSALPTGGNISILGGTLDIAGFSPTIAGLSFDRPATAARTVANSGASNAALTVNGGITFNGGNTPILISAGLNIPTGQLIVDDPTAFSFELPSPPVLSGRISGPGGLTKNSLFLTIALSGANTYVGPTIVNGGTLLLAATNTLPAITALTLNSAGLVLNTRARFALGGVCK